LTCRALLVQVDERGVDERQVLEVRTDVADDVAELAHIIRDADHQALEAHVGHLHAGLESLALELLEHLAGNPLVITPGERARNPEPLQNAAPEELRVPLLVLPIGILLETCDTGSFPKNARRDARTGRLVVGEETREPLLETLEGSPCRRSSSRRA